MSVDWCDELLSNQRIRREMRLARNHLGTNEHAERSARICRWLLNSNIFLAASRIAAYWPTDGEPDLLPLLQRLLNSGKDCFLPVILPFTRWPKQHKLGFAAADGPLRLNRYNIPEPTGRRVAAATLDLILLPLVAFNSRRERIGRGKGYYDQTLAPLFRPFRQSRPRLLGVAFAFQQAEAIQTASHDVPMDLIVTDEGVQPCR